MNKEVPDPVLEGDNKSRRSPVFSSVTRLTYPAWAAFDDLIFNYNVNLFFESPWIYIDAHADHALVEH